MTLSQYEKSFKLAREQYRSVYCGGPYTNIDMIQYLIDKSMIEPPNHQPSRRATIDDYVSRPDLVRRVTLEKMREDEMNTTGALHPLFAGRTGLCTSFAIKTAYSLKSLDQPAIYNFVFYDLGMHRLSICKNTKILIDSSALRPLRLQDGKELKVHRKIYCYENQELKFRREGEGKDQSKNAEALNEKEALIRCLQQLARNERAELLCFFRGYLPQKQKLGFDGMVKWIPAGKAVELSWNTGRVLKVSEIRFGPDGDDDTNQECLEEIEAFLRKKDYGIDRMEQFSCVRDWHETMWDAAVKKWGLPTLQPVREA